MKAPPPSAQLPPSDWVKRCIEHLRMADPALSEAEAAEVAQQLLSFERTGAMPPEAAVDFVMAQMATKFPRFERRSPNRLATVRPKK